LSQEKEMANWYARHVVPHLIRLGCGCQMIAEMRKPIVTQAKGRVLELGMGAGANMPWILQDQVSELVGIEPSDELREMALASPAARQLKPTILAAAAEELPFADASFDTVLCTFTLCTVSDPARALAEARRVLRPGGMFLFCEHGRAPDANVARWQERIDPIWSPITGGCHLSRPVRSAIENIFSVSDWEGGYQPKGPRMMGWMESGKAVAV
jgi:ubiquinone/menaquinone biosynthesis C-methylase UbiE